MLDCSAPSVKSPCSAVPLQKRGVTAAPTQYWSTGPCRAQRSHSSPRRSACAARRACVAWGWCRSGTRGAAASPLPSSSRRGLSNGVTPDAKHSRVSKQPSKEEVT